MKTKAGKKQSPKPRVPQAQHLAIAGKRMVLLEEEEYIRLRQKADDWEPLLPEPDANGCYPADETLGVILARKIIRRRRRLGLTQVELARKAGIRPETLNRIEQGKHSPSVATVEKIDRALKAAEATDT
jgi:DNA-binding XRE family transcriptional regulator